MIKGILKNGDFMRFFIQKALFPTLIFVAAFLLVLHFIKNNKGTADINYVIKAYKNTVALYSGEEIIKIYDNIVLNTLPEKDIHQFKKGVSVASLEQAEIYLEDFE